jgi:hypothetical protein
MERALDRFAKELSPPELLEKADLLEEEGKLLNQRDYFTMTRKERDVLDSGEVGGDGVTFRNMASHNHLLAAGVLRVKASSLTNPLLCSECYQAVAFGQKSGVAFSQRLYNCDDCQLRYDARGAYQCAKALISSAEKACEELRPSITFSVPGPFARGKTLRSYKLQRTSLWQKFVFDLDGDGPVEPKPGYIVDIPLRFDHGAHGNIHHTEAHAQKVIRFGAFPFVWNESCGWEKLQGGQLRTKFKNPTVFSSLTSPAELAEAWHSFRMEVTGINKAEWIEQVMEKEKEEIESLEKAEYKQRSELSSTSATILSY